MNLYRSHDTAKQCDEPGYRVVLVATIFHQNLPLNQRLKDRDATREFRFNTPTEVIRWLRETTDEEQVALLREVEPLACANVNHCIFEDDGEKTWIVSTDDADCHRCLTNTGRSHRDEYFKNPVIQFSLGEEAKHWPEGSRVLAARTLDADVVVIDHWDSKFVDDAAPSGYDRFCLMPRKLP